MRGTESVQIIGTIECAPIPTSCVFARLCATHPPAELNLRFLPNSSCKDRLVCYLRT